MATILVAEDRKGMRDMVVKVLSDKGHHVIEVNNGSLALEALEKSNIDLVITDLRMPEVDGMELLRRAKGINPEISVIMVTAFGTIDIAVEAMKQGAVDFLAKPFSISEMEIKVEKALTQQRLSREKKYLEEEVNIEYNFGDIIGPGSKMQEVYKLIRKVSKTDTSILIRGESGTGKELVARAVHYNSLRKDNAFVKVSCGALSEGVLESELFGHEKGAFTSAIEKRTGRFELSDKGTLFLDEIGDIPLNTQVKLLRVLQEREFERVGGTETIEVDVRIIAATHKNLEEEIRQGGFREDLYYRLNVVPIFIPPLRERKEDIPYLARHFLTKYAGKTNKKIKDISPNTLEFLMNYNWAGNVRELENAIERAVVLETGDTLTSQHLPLGMGTVQETKNVPLAGQNLTRTVEDVEKQIIKKALEDSDWNQSKAAEALGINRSSLYYKMLKYDLVKRD